MSNLLCKLGILSVSEEEKEEKDENKSAVNGMVNGNCSKKVPKKEKESVAVFDDDESCDKYLKTLDPKDWKNQDHYRVLGLSVRRNEATESEIKKSCKAARREIVDYPNN